MFENWLSMISAQFKAQIEAGVCALFWALYNNCNDVVFKRSKFSPFPRLFTRLPLDPLSTVWVAVPRDMFKKYG